MALKQKFSGDFSQLIKEHEKLLAAQVKQEVQLRDLKNAATSAGRANEKSHARARKGARDAIASIKSMAASYIGVQQAISLINSELRSKKELEASAALASVTQAQAESQIAVNFDIDASKEDIGKFINEVGNISVDLGFENADAVKSASAAILSATGGNGDLTKEVLREAGGLFKNDAEALRESGQVIGALASKAGLTVKEATALTVSTQNQARFTDLSGFKSVGPAIAAISNTVKTDRLTAAREGMAVFAAIGQQIEDGDGTVTKGAVAALGVALERNFEIDTTKFEKLVSEGVSIKDARQQSQLSFSQRLDRAQAVGDRLEAATNAGVAPAESDVATMKDLLSKGFRGPTIPVIRELLAGNDTRVAKAFDSILPKISTDGKLVDAKIDAINSATGNLSLASAEKRSKALLGQMQGGSSEAFIGMIDQIRKQALDNSGYDITGSGISNKLINAGTFYFGDESVAERSEVTRNILEDRKAALEAITPASQEESQRKAKALTLVEGSIKEVEKLESEFQRLNPPVLPPARPELPANFPPGFGPRVPQNQTPNISDDALRANTDAMNRMTDTMQAAAASQPTPPPPTPAAENAVPAPTTGNAAAQSRVHDERD